MASAAMRSRAPALPTMDAAVAWSIAASGSSIIPAASQPVARYTPSCSPSLPPAAASGGETAVVAAMSKHKFRRTMAAVDTSDTPALHLFDGAIGGHRRGGTPVRVIATDERAIALARSILHPVSTKRNPMQHADPTTPIVYLTGAAKGGQEVMASCGREGIASAATLSASHVKSVLLAVSVSVPSTVVLKSASLDAKTGMVVMGTTSAAPLTWNTDSTVSFAFRTEQASAQTVAPKAILVQTESAGRGVAAAQTKRQRALALAVGSNGADWTSMADSAVSVLVGGRNVTADKASGAKATKMSAAVEKALASEFEAMAGPGALAKLDVYAAD